MKQKKIIKKRKLHSISTSREIKYKKVSENKRKTNNCAKFEVKLMTWGDRKGKLSYI